MVRTDFAKRASPGEIKRFYKLLTNTHLYIENLNDLFAEIDDGKTRYCFMVEGDMGDKTITITRRVFDKKAIAKMPESLPRPPARREPYPVDYTITFAGILPPYGRQSPLCKVKSELADTHTTDRFPVGIDTHGMKKEKL